jgi:hypothetical protein
MKGVGALEKRILSRFGIGINTGWERWIEADTPEMQLFEIWLSDDGEYLEATNVS